MKRVLQLIGSFHQGGSERQAVALSGRLKAADRFDTRIATLDANGPLAADAASASTRPIEEFPLTSFYDANFVRQLRVCAKYLRHNEIELVHTHDFYTNVFGMAAATLAGTKAKVASKRETGGMRSRAQGLVERIAFARADAVVVNSQAVSEHLLGRGVNGEKLRLIYNGLDLERFGRLDGEGFRKTVGLTSGAPLITLVANLRHGVKNVPMLLRAAAKVPHAEFVIAGEGDLEGELKSLASTLGVAERVHFIGRCLDVPGLLAASFACVLTSRNEGFSNSILEYMAAGRPVVATNVGGAAEAITHGETGYLVASDDDRAMSDRLNELLNDREAAARMGGAACAAVAARFSVESQLDATTALYNSLLDR